MEPALKSLQQRDEYLKLLGIERWVPRHVAVAQTPVIVKDLPPAPVVEPGPSPEPTPTNFDALALDNAWRCLAEEVKNCQRCELHRTRTNTVFGVGNQQSRWLIIGEAPGAEEDKQGEPFVGRAGKLLNAMLLALGLQRGDVYITNILKCRPPQNRDPRPDEAASCADYLRRQIDLIRPQIILAVGRIAAQNLLNTSITIGKLRGQVHEYADTGIPLVVTYHPAYLLRSPAEKAKAWQDLKLARRTLLSQGA